MGRRPPAESVPHVVRVRICAPLETRIARMMERLSTDNRATVESEILLSEEAHGAITKRLFGVNWKDSEHYDLVLSTERLTVEECVEEIEGLMKRPPSRRRRSRCARSTTWRSSGPCVRRCGATPAPRTWPSP
jgi:hypothetical protein